jgi:hypothetical protein
MIERAQRFRRRVRVTTARPRRAVRLEHPRPPVIVIRCFSCNAVRSQHAFRLNLFVRQ